MEIAITAAALRAALTSAIPRGVHPDGYSHLTIEAKPGLVEWTYADPNHRITHTAPADVTAETAGPHPLPLRTFPMLAARAADTAGDIGIRITDGGEAVITTSAATFRCQTPHRDTLDQITPAADTPPGEPISALIDAIARATRAAISADHARPILCSVALRPHHTGGLFIATTDSYQLSFEHLPGADVSAIGDGILLPKTTVDHLLAADPEAEWQLAVDGHSVALAAPATTIMSSQTAGDPPNYERFVDGVDNPIRVAVAAPDLRAALKLADIGAQAETIITCAVADRKIAVSQTGTDASSKTAVEADHNEDITLSFQAKRLGRLLAECPGTAELAFAGPANPVLITCPEHPHWTGVVMPVQQPN
ncbi:MAG: hypothetical protein OXG44_17455 [Gammaproteobacteria bacterium]|nr:hypothetical protein [Gammaproteobacteria bacterium]